jgi:DNA replication and repair protein RecF
MLQRVTWQGDLPVILRAVNLLHYRNLDAARLSFTPGLTGVVGSNGQGKTNLLEGIYLALTGILEVSRIETAITLGQHEGFVGVDLEREDGLTRLEVGLAPGKKLAKVDGNRVRAAELSRHGAAVWIRPEDAELVHGSPAGRRAFLDALVSRMSPRYAQVLALFERTLTQRNAVLRQADTTGLDGLEVWDARIAALGAEIVGLRRRAVNRLAGLTALSHDALSGNGKPLQIQMLETAPVEGFLEALQSRRREELARGSTAIGPHRDDLEITLGNLNAVDFASRGEARTIALALRKAEYDLFTEKFAEAPVLLIDDFTAELDRHRRAHLMDLAENAPQAIVTGTDAPPGTPRLLEIRSGQIVNLEAIHDA